ncbi:MAG TPA: acyltransferase [Stellaceae bacterium]|nr:acyltransferase [Stellaceae bacterium]
MFEIIRYTLALIVADTHLWPIGFVWAGWQAVFAFYTLSGYLMTRVLNERYGFAWSGIAAFLLNRVLRLWPAYLFIVAVTWVAVRFLPLDSFFFSLTPPRTVLEKVTTLTVLGQVGFDFTYLIPLSRLAPTSWSLSIELVSYCLLGLYFARTPRRLFVFAALGLIAILGATGYCVAEPSIYYGPYCSQNRYGVVQAGFIPFAMGGLVYFYRPALHNFLASYGRWLVAGLLVAEASVVASVFSSVTIGPFIGALAIAATIAWHGTDYRPGRAIDFIGRASYHLFIGHLSIAAILVVGLKFRANAFPVFAASLIVALLLSGFLVPLEWWLNGLRGRLSRWGGRSARPPAGASSDPAFAEVAGGATFGEPGR